MENYISSKDSFSLMIKALENKALLTGVIAIGKQINPDTNELLIEKEIADIVVKIRKEVRSGLPQAYLAHMGEMFHNEMNLRIEEDSPFKIEAQSIHNILDTGVGSYSVMAAIYFEVAQRLGLKVWGTSFPTLMMVGIEDQLGKNIYLDPTTGIHYPVSELKEMFEDQDWQDGWLKPVSPRVWLGRIINTAIRIYEKSNSYNQWAALTELQSLLFPLESSLQRDLGALYAKLGHVNQAKVVLQDYRVKHPEDQDALNILQNLQNLG